MVSVRQVHTLSALLIPSTLIAKHVQWPTGLVHPKVRSAEKWPLVKSAGNKS